MAELIPLLQLGIVVCMLFMGVLIMIYVASAGKSKKNNIKYEDHINNFQNEENSNSDDPIKRM